MDLSFVDSNDIVDVLATIETFGQRRNKDMNRVLIFSCLGTSGSRQSSPIAGAIKTLARKYAAYGIAISEVTIDNDTIKQHGWSVDQYFNEILKFDIHFIPSYIHHNMLGLAGESWTMANIYKLLPKLKYHLGIPMGKYLWCPIWRRDKWQIFRMLKDLSVPCLRIKMTEEGVSMHDLWRLARFVARMEAHTVWSNQGQFKVKLSHSTGEQYKEKCKSATGGLPGITECIASFFNNNDIRGYIEDVLVAPYVKENSEVKMVCFDGVALFANRRKRSTHGGSGFPKAPMDSRLTEFAEQVVSIIQGNDCAITDQVMRVDFFCDRSTDTYFVNSVSGFDAEAEGVGNGSNYATVLTKSEAWWFINGDKLIKRHLQTINHPVYQMICEDDATGVQKWNERPPPRKYKKRKTASATTLEEVAVEMRADLETV